MSYFKQIWGAVSAAVSKPVRIDSVTEALLTIDYDHHELHDGGHFTVGKYQDLASAGVLEIRVSTPNVTAPYAHMLWEVATEGEFAIDLFEGPTVISAGVAVTTWNRNRNSAGAAIISVYTTGEISATGSTLLSQKVGSGRLAGGGARGSSEWMLANNQNYVFRLTNAGAGTLWVSWQLDWYEHTDRN